MVQSYKEYSCSIPSGIVVPSMWGGIYLELPFIFLFSFQKSLWFLLFVQHLAIFYLHKSDSLLWMALIALWYLCLSCLIMWAILQLPLVYHMVYIYYSGNEHCLSMAEPLYSGMVSEFSYCAPLENPHLLF